VRAHRYRVIADDLRRRIVTGELEAGGLLPSESSLSAAYAASRITVRRALDVLRDEGLVGSRQGFGWFVEVEPVRQRLGALVTIEDELAESGLASERRVLEFAFVRAPAAVRKALDTDRVLAVRRLTLAGGRPFAVVTVWCADDVGRRLSRDDVERTTFHELLRLPLAGATQTIAADAASPRDADDLDVVPGSPVLVVERVTRAVAAGSAPEGRAVLVSRHVFPAHATRFVIDLPGGTQRFAPS
jgi:GntR family transcriptional regulator